MIFVKIRTIQLNTFIDYTSDEYTQTVCTRYRNQACRIEIERRFGYVTMFHEKIHGHD